MGLRDVMQTDVVALDPGATLAVAAQEMRRRKASAAVVVSPDGAPLGILSERAFVQAVVDGDDPAVAVVRPRMSISTVSLGPDADVAGARDLMARHNLHHLPVVDGGRVVGLYSLHDPVARPDEPAHADTFGGTGMLSHFKGPYSGGVPPEALVVDAPDLHRFGLAEIRRMVVIYVVLVVCVLRGLARRLRRPRRSWAAAGADGMVDGFEILGPTFVKLGQLVASSPGVFPAVMAEACLRCLDEVPPFDGATARRLIEEDLSRPPSQIFKAFDEVPVSAASIGQVHTCVLPDGRDAVIKLQRPNISERMNTDLRIVCRIAKQVQRTKLGRNANVVAMVEDLHQLTNQELNFALEAHRQNRFRSHIGDYGDNRYITAPEVYWDYCGPHMICMERMVGVPMDEAEAIRARGVDGELVIRRGVKVWMEALMVHGPFHGDVHAGNLWLLEDGRAAYLDFGIMGEVSDAWKGVFKDMFYTAMIDQDFRRTVRAYKRVGVLPQEADETHLTMLFEVMIGPLLDRSIGETSLGEVFKSSLTMAEHSGVPTPKELLLVAKQLLYFERYAKLLAPNYVMARDVFLIKNVFPDDVAKKAAELGVELPE
jgi:predicted unusual protein kinase regulating ubiquinone biosynthesis (AarF/ABC1/UbiB family)/CBS domain-containing protein